MTVKYFMAEINLMIISLMLFIISHVFNVIVFYVGQTYAIFMFFPVEIGYMTNIALYAAITLQLIAISLMIIEKIKEGGE